MRPSSSFNAWALALDERRLVASRTVPPQLRLRNETEHIYKWEENEENLQCTLEHSHPNLTNNCWISVIPFLEIPEVDFVLVCDCLLTKCGHFKHSRFPLIDTESELGQKNELEIRKLHTLVTHSSSNQGDGDERDWLEVFRKFDAEILLVGEPHILKCFEKYLVLIEASEVLHVLESATKLV